MILFPSRDWVEAPTCSHAARPVNFLFPNKNRILASRGLVLDSRPSRYAVVSLKALVSRRRICRHKVCSYGFARRRCAAGPSNRRAIAANSSCGRGPNASEVLATAGFERQRVV